MPKYDNAFQFKKTTGVKTYSPAVNPFDVVKDLLDLEISWLNTNVGIVGMDWNYCFLGFGRVMWGPSPTRTFPVEFATEISDPIKSAQNINGRIVFKDTPTVSSDMILFKLAHHGFDNFTCWSDPFLSPTKFL